MHKFTLVTILGENQKQNSEELQQDAAANHPAI